MSAPKIPNSISADGKEAWDWAENLVRWSDRQHRINELKRKIVISGTTCGQCSHWMKSSLCPKEKNVKGYTQGPSINSPICDKFLISKDASKMKDQMKAELSKLEGVAE